MNIPDDVIETMLTKYCEGGSITWAQIIANYPEEAAGRRNAMRAALSVLSAEGWEIGPGKYLVWSSEYRMWWRANSMGYAMNVSEAGRYTRKEAMAICKDARDGWRRDTPPPEIPVREVDAVSLFPATPSPRREGE